MRIKHSAKMLLLFDVEATDPQNGIEKQKSHLYRLKEDLVI